MISKVFKEVPEQGQMWFALNLAVKIGCAPYLFGARCDSTFSQGRRRVLSLEDSLASHPRAIEVPSARFTWKVNPRGTSKVHRERM